MTAVVLLVALLQAKTAPVDPRVEAAIQRGLDYLKKSNDSPPFPNFTLNSDELILLALLHGGVPPSDPKVQALLKKVDGSFERVYNVALKAMLLQKLDPAKYHARLAQCAQYLVDNQCPNGQWSYGIAMDIPEKVGVPSGPPPLATGAKAPRVPFFIQIKRTRDGEPHCSNNSATQYAALGLRACYEAGILVPEECLQRAVKWLKDTQMAEEGWNERAKPLAVGGKEIFGGPGTGWGYWQHGRKEGDRPYATLTVGAVGSLVIFDHQLGVDFRKDPVVRGGMNWLAEHFSVTENVGVTQFGRFAKDAYLYYYLYGLERAAMLYGTDRLGPHAWYGEGARVLLEAQKPDGSWNYSPYEHLSAKGREPVWDTCFAILFLKKATKPLMPVVSEDRFIKDK